MLAILTAGVVILTAAAYWRGHENDPGLTTEITLILTALLGGLSMQQPSLAGGLAVAVAVLLAARSQLHHFVRSVLTEEELIDALIFASATLIVLPLVPDRPMGPYGALNPHSIWILVILIMAISAAGYCAVRLVGARFGLPIAGLASGFISSTATIGAMGARASKTSVLTRCCSCGSGLVNHRDHRPDGDSSRRYQLDYASDGLQCHIVLRWLGRGRLWDCFYGSSSAGEN